MSAQPLITVTLPIGTSSDNITTEEEDHLIRSTKKVKNDHDYSVDMAEDTPGVEKPQIEDTALSFKQALIASRGKEIPFSEDVESIPIEDEITEEEKNIDEEEEIDGIPVVKIPKSLLNYGRQPWKNAIIVKPIGYPIGYKSLCTKVRTIWDLQGDFSALEIGLGFVVFKFDMRSDRTHVLIAGHRKDQCSWGTKITSPPVGDQVSEQRVTANTPTTVEKPILGNAAQLPAYGQWTLVQRKPRRPNTGKRYTDRNQVAHNGKSQGPNAQKMDARETNPSQQPSQKPPISSVQIQPHGNRDLPPPPSADLHPNQTRGRGRSSSEGHLVDSEGQDGSDGSRMQCSESSVLCGGSGKSERHSPGPNGDQETCRME
ncbi:hypothetical protein Vadar_013733 [Vaccinium darrowii]|uniref:Uncharacterized protein n=1 Tax=Vaccinium darrowii TaxID=229202 RepID=A0ACB7YMQ6_9ERIC|nr:hypothetical protein Vadar_013733 [Vaccinium darrowii]